jgi:hypothetical protein
MAQQIKHKLTTVAWPGGSAEVVFGTYGVHVFSGTPTEEQIPPGFPWAMVGVDTGSPDEDHPEFIEQGFTVMTAVDVSGDPLGEFSMIGSSTSDLGISAGRGILEIATLTRQAVEDLTGADGAKVLLSSTSTGSPALLSSGRHLALGNLGLTALCTSALHYAAPQQFARSGTAWSWEGAHCSDRFDFVRYKMGYKAGSSPTSPADFDTLVYTGTTASTTHTVVAGKYYGVFAEYASRDQTTPTIEGNSDSVVGSTLDE